MDALDILTRKTEAALAELSVTLERLANEPLVSPTTEPMSEDTPIVIGSRWEARKRAAA